MIKFLVTAAIVLVCLFVLVLMCCLMVWVVARLLRFLFPQRFGGRPCQKSKSPVLNVRLQIKIPRFTARDST